MLQIHLDSRPVQPVYIKNRSFVDHKVPHFFAEEGGLWVKRLITIGDLVSPSSQLMSALIEIIADGDGRGSCRYPRARRPWGDQGVHSARGAGYHKQEEGESAY